jgi:hypothetical protein
MLDDGVAAARWQAKIAVCDAPLQYPILGRAGCLEFYDCRFRGAQQVVDVEPNSAFAGMVDAGD